MQMIIGSTVGFEVLGLSRQGQSLPLMIRCESHSEDVVCLTKIVSKKTGLTCREMCLEVLGTLLAQEMNLSAATPMVVRLSEAVRNRVQQEYAVEATSVWAFGTLWAYDLIPFIPRLHRERASFVEAGRTFALDILLANSDRTPLNPNLAWKDGRLFVFDFEQCLNLPLTWPAEAFGVHCSLARNLKESHVLFPLNDQAAFEASRCIEMLSQRIAGSPSLRTAEEFLPSEWLEDWRKLVGYVDYLAKHAPALKGAMKL